MKNTLSLHLLIFLFIGIPSVIFSQDDVHFDIDFQINKVYPSFPVSIEDISTLETFEDLNRFYKSSWIKEFVTVKMTTTVDGKAAVLETQNDKLSKAHKDLMKKADYGAAISIDIEYYPNNTLTNNEIHLFDFKFSIEPLVDASFDGEKFSLNQYLNTHLKEQIPTEIFKQYQLAVVQFTINKDGFVNNAEIIASSNDEKTDEYFLKVVKEMPCWIPAAYGDGTNVEQTFALTAGDHTSCNLNLVNIRKNWPREN